MAISINSFAPNTQAKSSEVNQNFTNLKSGVEDASYRAIPWGLLGGLTVADEQGLKIICPQNVTLSKLWAKTGSGTCTIRIQKGTTDLKTSFDVTSTIGSTTSFDSTTITAGDLITLDITAQSSGIDLFVTLECQVTSIV